MEQEIARVCFIYPKKKARADLLIPLQISPIDLICALNNAYMLGVPKGREHEAYLKMEEPDGLLMGTDSLGMCGVRRGSSLIFDMEPEWFDTPTSGEIPIPFDNHLKHPERKIWIPENGLILIGADQAHICLKSRHAAGIAVRLTCSKGGMRVEKRGAQKIYLNSRPLRETGLMQNGDFLWIEDFVFCYKYPHLLTEIRTDMDIRLPFQDSPVDASYPLLLRTTRVLNQADMEPIEILDPPPRKEYQKRDLLSRLLPAAGFLLMGLVMALAGGRSFLLFAGFHGFLGLVTAVSGLYGERNREKRENRLRLERYEAYLADRISSIEEARSREKQQMEETYLNPEGALGRIGSFSPCLFDRSTADPDFMHLRMGTGPVKAKRIIRIKMHDDFFSEDEVYLFPQQIKYRYDYLLHAPVTVDLSSRQIIGIAGGWQARWDFLKNTVLDLVSRQDPRDMQLMLFGTPREREAVRIFRFFPHFMAEDGRICMALSEESRRKLLQYLYQKLDGESETEKKPQQHMVVFLMEDMSLLSHPAYRLPSQRVSLFFFQEDENKLPSGCRYVIRLNAGEGEMIDSETNSRTAFVYGAPTDGQIRTAASVLAPLRMPEFSLESALPKAVELFDILPQSLLNPGQIGRRWLRARSEETLSVPVGISRQGLVLLDLSDRADGPHGLIAGTTGSGKSEWLLTYILAVCASFHPRDVGFLIIDFKGGSMADRLKALPHMRGVLTNLETAFLNRSLIQIQAEVKKRQEVFASAGVSHIDEYIRLYKAKKAQVPIPHLIIVVDEFAELKAQRPEFMKALISISRIGRSLGIHLLLATQKPAGQIDDQIWSNTRFKICLRVQSRSDSNEVLHSPLASEIREPGRAILKIGENEVFELFQGAYAGAAFREEGEGQAFSIYQVGEFDQQKCIYQSPALRKRKDSKSEWTAQLHTQMDKLMEAICQAFADFELSIPDQHSQELPGQRLSAWPYAAPGMICLPPLEEAIAFPTETAASEALEYGDGMNRIQQIPKQLQALAGIMDLPEEMSIKEWKVDVSAGNVLIAGDAGMGKTNLLKTIISSLCMQFLPTELEIYLLDFDTGALSGYGIWPQVGDALTIRDEEKLGYLRRMLEKEMQTRREYLKEIGASSERDFHADEQKRPPHLLLIVDGFGAMKEMTAFEGETERFWLQLLRDGPALGMTLIAANTGTIGISFRELSFFSRRIVFYCADQGAYAQLLGSTRLMPECLPGRALLLEKAITVKAQCYLAPETTRVSEKVMQHSGVCAEKIPVIPERLNLDLMYQQLGGEGKGQLIGGLKHETMDPWLMDPFETGLMGFCGERSRCEEFVYFLLQSLFKKTDCPIRLYLSDGPENRLSGWKNSFASAVYTNDPQEGASYLAEIEEKLRQTQLALRRGDKREKELAVLVTDDEEMMEETGRSLKIREACRNILGKYRRFGILLLLILPDRPLYYAQDEIRSRLRDQRRILFFGEIDKFALFDLSLSRLQRQERNRSSCDAFYIDGREVFKVRVPEEAFPSIAPSNTGRENH